MKAWPFVKLIPVRRAESPNNLHRVAHDGCSPNQLFFKHPPRGHTFSRAVFVRGDSSACRQKHNPPHRVAVDGLNDGCYSEGEADEPSAGVGKCVEKGEKCGSSNVR